MTSSDKCRSCLLRRVLLLPVMPVHASAAAPSTLPTLPYDILALIIAHGQNSRPTLLAICLASRDLHTLATTELYRVLHFDWSDAPERIDILFQTLSSNRDLALRVTSLSLASRLPEPSLPKFVEALRHMLMLRHFYYVDIGKIVELCPDVLSVIAQLTQLRSMRISSWITSHADYWHKVLDCLPPMTAITIQVDHARISALERLLLRSVDTLESLILWGAYDIDAFLSSSAAGVVWGRLRALELYSMDEVSSARAFPHVERLCLAMPAPAIIADPAAFPLATQFTLCAGGAPFDAVEHLSLRRVRHLVVNVTLNSGPGVLSTVDYQAFLGTFHSATLYSLSLGLYDLPDLLNSETLVNILRNCTNLRYLGFQLTQNVRGSLRVSLNYTDSSTPDL